MADRIIDDTFLTLFDKTPSELCKCDNDNGSRRGFHIHGVYEVIRRKPGMESYKMEDFIAFAPKDWKP